MKTLWQINNFKAFPLLFQIGFRNGLKSGDRPTDKEWAEVHKRHHDWVSKLGGTELSMDELIKEQMSKGQNILGIEEKDGKPIYKIGKGRKE